MSCTYYFKTKLCLLFIFTIILFFSGKIQAQNSLKELHVSSICQQNSSSENQWRIRNPNDKDVNVTFSTAGAKQVKSLVAKAMDDTFFFTEATEKVDILYNDDEGDLIKITTVSGGESCIIDCPGDADRYVFNVSVTDHELVEGENTLQIPDLFCEGETAVLTLNEGSFMDLFKDGSGARMVMGATIKSGGCEFNGKQFQFDMLFDKLEGGIDLTDLGIDPNKLQDLIAALSIRSEGVKIRQSGSNYTASLSGMSSIGEFNFSAALTKEEEGFTFHLDYVFGEHEGSASFDAKIGVSCPEMSVLNYTLVNAETGEDIRKINDGDVIDLAQLPTDKLNIRANTNPENVGSVVFDLNEKKGVQTEIVNPYSLFGNFAGGVYKQWTPEPGKYMVTATPYSKTKARGEKGTPLTINFEFIDSDNEQDEQQIVSYVLVNAETNEDIMPLNDGDKLDLSTLPTNKLNVRANTNPENVGSVIFDLNNTKNYNTENVNPYSLAANFEGGSYKTWNPEPGMYTITATPYTMKNGTAEAGKLKTIKVEFTDKEGDETEEEPQQQQQVVSFSLINADTDDVIAILKDGDIVNLAALPESNLKLRTNTEPEIVGSVIFDLNEFINVKIVNDAPYDLEGVDIADYISMFDIIGKHMLTATPYSDADGAGDEGKGLTITLELMFDPDNDEIIVRDTENLRVAAVYPNPVEDHFTVQHNGVIDANTSILIFDQYGKAVKVEKSMMSNNQSVLSVDISELQLRAGIYYIKFQEAQNGKMMKIIKK